MYLLGNYFNTYSRLSFRWRCEGYCRLLFVSSGLMSPPPFFLKLQELNRNSSTSSSVVSRRENCFLLTFLCFFAPTLEIPQHSMLRTNEAKKISWQILSNLSFFLKLQELNRNSSTSSGCVSLLPRFWFGLRHFGPDTLDWDLLDWHLLDWDLLDRDTLARDTLDQGTTEDSLWTELLWNTF